MAKLPTSVPPQLEGRPKADRRALRGRLIIGGKSRAERTSPRTLLAAIAVHVVVLAVLVRLVSLGHGLHDWFGLIRPDEVREERVTYVEPRKPEPKPPAPKPKPAVTPAPAATASAPAAPAVAPVAPMVVAVDPAPVSTGRAGDSSAVGGGKPRDLGIDPALVGLAPANADPRVWLPSIAGINVERTGQQMIDSVIGWAIASAADSLDSIARLYDVNREPADWTKRMKNGEKWGWDKTGLRLGKYTVPNILLALLPASVQRNMGSNPIEASRARALLLARDDINRFSSLAMGEADFRKAVKETRQRKDREYQKRAKARAAENNKPAPIPPKSSGGN